MARGSGATRILTWPTRPNRPLGLSTLRFALNGAEPVDVAAVERFLGAGKRWGLRRTAVAQEDHGRAARVGVDGAATSSDAGATDVRRFPLLGPPLPGIEAVIRNESGDHLGVREVGTIAIRGDSVTSEYLTVDGPVSTRDAEGWWDTGDLGYLTETGAVVVCGRVKGVIIMGGRNIYSTDIERVAEAVDGVRAGNAAAARVDAGPRRESFAVVVESKLAAVEAENKRIAAAVRAAVTSQVGVRPASVLVLRPGKLPKTPSGKIQRAAAAALLDS